MYYRQICDCVFKAEGFVGKSLNNLNTKVDVPLAHYACFARAYSYFRSNSCEFGDIKYSLYLYKDDIPNKNFNLCSEKETKIILNNLKKVVPFTYTFSTDKFRIGAYDDKITDYKVINFHVVGNYTQHVWLTSVLRCFFEYPWNAAAKEVMTLKYGNKKSDKINIAKENWVNLFFSISSVLGASEGHGVATSSFQPSNLTYKQWKEKLEKCKGFGSVYEKIGNNRFTRGSYRSQSINNDADLKENFDTRFPQYIKVHKEKIEWKKK